MFGKIREYFARQQAQKVMVNLIDMWQSNRPLAQVWDVAAFTNDGYRRNTLIFACVTAISTSFSQPPMVASAEQKEGEPEPLPKNHRLSVLLAQPNKRESGSAFMRRFATHLDVAGNAYVLKVRSGAQLPVELKLLRPDVVRPVPDPNGEIVAYAYGSEPNLQMIPAKDVIHEIYAPDPLEQFRGLSPIAVLARMGDLDNFAGDYLRAFFLNAGIPSGLLKFKTQVPKDEAIRVKTRWKEMYQGAKGWWDIGVIDSDVEYQEIGSKLKMMDLEGVFGQTESRICSAFGVPPIIVGSWLGLMRSTYANYESARKSFYQDTLMPMWQSCSARFTEDLASEFGDNIVINWDLSGIDGLQEEAALTREYAIRGWDSGLLTKNEARALVGEDPDVAGDVFKQKLTETYVPADSEEQQLVPGWISETLRRALPTESHQTADQWRLIQEIADGAAPEVKKNCLKRLQTLKRARR